MTTCAVVPTFNRRTMVLRCVEALQRQSAPLDHILVVDNASSDGTSAALAAAPNVTVLRNAVNTGSAGGFGTGIRWAVEQGFDWIWLIDDDSLAEPEAHAELLAAWGRFPEAARPVLLASRVEWTDGTILPMNAPMFRRRELQTFYAAAEAGTLSIRMAPYAGVLLHRSLPLRYGLPIEEYFLWNDDVEYTGRLLRRELGVLAPRSVVCHEVPTKDTTSVGSGDRFYYEVRNKLWMIRGSRAYGPAEKARFGASLALLVLRFLGANPPWFGLRVVLAGVFRGLVSPAPSDGGPLRPSPPGGTPASSR